MPFSGGTFTNVAGATTAVPGQIIQSAVWDAIHTDYATAFTMTMSQLISEVTNRNILWMNGGFEIWQRGSGATSSFAVPATTTSYTADRWYLTTGANEASVVAAVTGLSNGSQLAVQLGKNAAQAGTAVMTFGYPLDTDEVFRLRGSKVSLSFLVKAGANWSPASGTLSVALYVGTGAVAKRGGGFAGETQVLSINTNLTPGGATVQISGSSSGTVPITATQGELQFTWTPVGAAGATDVITIDDVELECQLSTSTWTPMNYDRLDFSTMLIGCKRHYRKTLNYSLAPQAGAGISNALSILSQAIARAGIFWQYDVEMRVGPSFTTYHPTTATASSWVSYTLAGTSASLLASTDQFNTSATKGMMIYAATAAVDTFYYLHAQADAGI